MKLCIVHLMKHCIMKYEFNEIEFARQVKVKRTIDLDVDLRTVAKRIGVSASTLSRIENKGIPDIATFLKVCEWMNVNPLSFLLKYKKSTKR